MSHLNRKLLIKLSKKVGKSKKYVREQISKRASRYGISSEAAQIQWAKEFGLGTATFQRSLPSHIQEQIHANATFVSGKPYRSIRGNTNNTTRIRDPVRMSIDSLISDKELKKRCADLLKAKGNFDRVFREATTVLDHRLRILGSIKGKILPEDLVGKVLSPDPNKAIIRVSVDNAEQEGFYSICKGIFLAFRNPTHHQLTDKFTREDALKFCGFVDYILTVLKQAQKNNGL